MSNQKGLNVYDTAKVGCNYAQPKTGNQKLWNVRRVKIDHNLGDEQCGGLAVHNHNCLTGKEREALKFDRCYSDYYYTAVSHLRALYPANKEYQLAFEAAYKKQFADRKDLAPYPPCIFAVLDTWFEYSDIEISDKYSRLQGAISGFKIKLDSAAKGLKDWAADEIKARRKALDIKRANAQWSNAASKEDNRTSEELLRDVDEDSLLFDLLHEIDPLYKRRNNLIDEVNEYWEDIMIFEKGYPEKLVKIGDSVQEYIDEWTAIVKGASLDLANPAYTTFVVAFSEISECASSIGESMADWETEMDHELLTSSFLICKCGGKIEFLSSGQEHLLYCAKLVTRFVEMMESFKGYLDELYENKRYFGGATDLENEVSMSSSSRSLANIIESFHVQGKEFILDENTVAMQLRFITKGYNKEKSKWESAMIGMVVLTPLSIYGAMAGGGTAVAISLGILVFDGYNVYVQDQEGKKENFGGDTVTISNDVVSLASSGFGFYDEQIGSVAPTLKKFSTYGNVTIAIGFLNSMNNMFYTSEEDWIEDIEITLFTKTMAFIAKQRYDDEVNPIEKFDGIRMMKVKSKVDYICDSLVPVNWDDLEGVELAVDRNYSKDEEFNVSQKVDNAEEVYDTINKNTNGSVNP